MAGVVLSDEVIELLVEVALIMEGVLDMIEVDIADVVVEDTS